MLLTHSAIAHVCAAVAAVAACVAVAAAVCLTGFGRASGDSDTCVRCPQGTYSFGDAFDDCYECPFPKTTSFSGATSDKDCGACTSSCSSSYEVSNNWGCCMGISSSSSSSSSSGRQHPYKAVAKAGGETSEAQCSGNAHATQVSVWAHRLQQCFNLSVSNICRHCAAHAGQHQVLFLLLSMLRTPAAC
jgi:hypothetical protein